MQSDENQCAARLLLHDRDGSRRRGKPAAKGFRLGSLHIFRRLLFKPGIGIGTLTPWPGRARSMEEAGPSKRIGWNKKRTPIGRPIGRRTKADRIHSRRQRWRGEGRRPKQRPGERTGHRTTCDGRKASGHPPNRPWVRTNTPRLGAPPARPSVSPA